MEAKLPAGEPPKPTNFSNTRSQIYLNGMSFRSRRQHRVQMKPKFDIEESKKISSKPQELTSAQKTNDRSYHTESHSNRTAFGPLHIQRTRKLEPKFLPLGNDSFIEAAIASAVKDSTEKSTKGTLYKRLVNTKCPIKPINNLINSSTESLNKEEKSEEYIEIENNIVTSKLTNR